MRHRLDLHADGQIYASAREDERRHGRGSAGDGAPAYLERRHGGEHRGRVELDLAQGKGGAGDDAGEGSQGGAAWGGTPEGFPSVGVKKKDIFQSYQFSGNI